MERLLKVVALLWVATFFGCGVSGGGAKDETVTPTPAVVAVSVSPGTASVVEGSTQIFHATVSGTNNAAVIWSATAGTIDTTGLFTAPDNLMSVTITATLQADGTKRGTATVTVVAPSPPATLSAELVQASGVTQSVGNVRNSPIIGEPIAIQTASASTVQVRHGFDPH